MPTQIVLSKFLKNIHLKPSLLSDSPCSSEVRIIRWKFSLSTLFENLFSEALLLNSRLYWPIKVVETYFRRLAVLLFPRSGCAF